jgi:hypothetical protein
MENMENISHFQAHGEFQLALTGLISSCFHQLLAVILTGLISSCFDRPT